MMTTSQLYLRGLSCPGIDIDPKREADIPIQAVPLNDLLNTLTSMKSKDAHHPARCVPQQSIS